MADINLKAIVERYKGNPESVYNTWFIDNDARMKAFRSIGRGLPVLPLRFVF